MKNKMEQNENNEYEYMEISPEDMTDENGLTGFRGVWIPAELWLDDSITWEEMILLKEIWTYKSGICWKTNKSLAKFMRCGEKTVSRVVKKLVEKGYITSHMITHSHGSRRILKLTKEGWIKVRDPHGLKVSHSNTEIDTTEESTLSSSYEDSPQQAEDTFDWEKFLEMFNRLTGRSFKVIPEQVRRKYRARIREGYTKKDLVKALIAVTADKDFMKDFGRYITPEWLSRSKSLERWANEYERKEEELANSYESTMSSSLEKMLARRTHKTMD